MLGVGVVHQHQPQRVAAVGGVGDMEVLELVGLCHRRRDGACGQVGHDVDFRRQAAHREAGGLIGTTDRPALPCLGGLCRLL